MRTVLAVVIVSLLFWTDPALSGDSPDPMEHDVQLLREAFEGPLQIELKMRGLSKNDAVAASSEALDWLESCWRNQRDNSIARTEEIMVVQLGGSAIVTYADPCVYEFIDLVLASGK